MFDLGAPESLSFGRNPLVYAGFSLSTTEPVPFAPGAVIRNSYDVLCRMVEKRETGPSSQKEKIPGRSTSRIILHERIGGALETLNTSSLDDHLVELAHHHDRGGNVGKAAEYLGRAGIRTAEQAAYSGAIGYLTRALELLSHLPDGAERDRRELEQQMALSASLHVLRGPGAPEREKALMRHRRCLSSSGI